MTELDRREIERILAAGGGGRALIPTLVALQERLGHLPREALHRLLERDDVSAAQLASVLSFYPRFRTRPAGRHRVQVCLGTACHVRGAADTLAEIRHQLAIAEGEDTDPQGLFTVEPVACLGCCMLAPVVRIDHHTYARVDAAAVPDLLSGHLGRVARDDGESTPTGERASSERAGTGELRLCRCTSCASAGADALARALQHEIAALDLPVRLRSVACTGRSWDAPLVEIRQDAERWRYGRVDPEIARPLLLEHFQPAGMAGRVGARASRLLERLLDSDEEGGVASHRLEPDAPGQVRRSTLHAGEADPLDLDDYLARGGFEALRATQGALGPEGALARIATAGLRGRGGAGYDAARKWRETKASAGAPKVVVCNADEGEPGAFMDRMILESFPFRVLEGMAIAAAVIGASRGYLYVRGAYRQAIERLRRALAACTARGLLGAEGEGVLRPFSVEIFESAGGYVCGEETALLEAMEGRRGTPRIRPPYPSERGLEGLPTLVNNVETFALVPGIVAEGPETFAALGTPGSSGTKTFALAGRVARGGLVEVAMGTTLRQIVEDIGGGVPGARALKAIHVGGPSGGCVPAALADTPLDYEALQSAGAIMGTGGLIVLDEGDCVVDLARYYTAFARRESCGRCSACRIGTARLLEIMDDICEGRGTEVRLARIEELGQHLATTSRCGLGRTAPNAALSTLRHFRDEYLAHIEGRCPAGRCKALVRYRVAEHCIGCTRCAQRCPSGAVNGEPHQRHHVDDGACTRCDVCRQACPVGAVEVE